MKTIYKYLSLLAFLSLIFSCDLVGDLDDIKPEGVLTDGNEITNARTAELALTGIYASWQNIKITEFIHYTSMRAGSQRPFSGDGFGFPNNDIKTNNIKSREYYNALYLIINTSNTFLTNLQKNNPKDIDEQRKKEMIAEAKFHRAAAHFNLLRSFGEFTNTSSTNGIVLHTKPVRDNTPVARANVANSYQLIIEDLTAAAKDAPEQANKHSLISKTTAKALLAKVHLAKTDFENAAKWANAVITEANNHGYSLEANYKDIFTNKFNSTEVLWAPEILQRPDQLPLMQPIGEPGLTLQTIAEKLGEKYGSERPNSGGIFPGGEPPIPGDDTPIPGDGGTIPGSPETPPSDGGVIPGDGTVFPGGGGIPGGGTPQTNKKYDNRYLASYSPYGILKYEPSFELVNGAPDNTMLFLRLAEIYLIAAEAEFRKTGGDKAKAKTYLQAVLTRASYPADYAKDIENTEFLQTLLKHKYLELSNETGQEWFDLMRYKALDNMQVSPEYIANDKHLSLPIPISALAGNNLLKQNPSYIGN